MSEINTNPSAFDHLITPTMLGYEGLAGMIRELEENPVLRSAMLLRTTTTLRDRLRELPFEASCSEPVTITAQDALLLLTLLLQKLS